MQNNSKRKYSKVATSLKSKGRIFKESKDRFRTDFNRDRDRIIHSTAFRRLKHKTQVFVNTNFDHYRTRMTHTLEVAQISRTLSKVFNLNEELSESVSLAHDLGHPPFGHAGEEVLNECMEKYGGFDHNIQSLRIITLLENRYYKFKGLNLCLETIDGIIKHNGPIYKQKKIDNILGKNFFKNKIDYIASPSLEAQISSISDDIAYNSHDIEDGLNAGILKLSSLKEIEILKNIINKNLKKRKNNSLEIITRQIIRELINKMVNDVIFNTKKNIKYNKISNSKNVLNADYPIVCFSKDFEKLNYQIKEFLSENMYFNKQIIKKTDNGKFIIKKLFNHMIKKPNNFINLRKKDKINYHRNICDYIAGMTDRYAINLYKGLQ